MHTADSSSANSDTFGHGTAVASLAAGASLGVARKATIHSVKITSTKSAWESDMIQGMDWVIANKQQPAVMNLSFTADTDALAEALEAVADAGVVVTKAAGNDGVDACSDSGNTAPSILVVGATDSMDRLAPKTNVGTCVDIFAPGVGVRYADFGSNTGTSTDGWGTSFAAPYVAGIAAILRGQTPGLSVFHANSLLLSSSYRNELTAADGSSTLPAGSPNALANSIHTSALIDGVTSIEADYSDPISESWTARPYGGDGNYTYKWEKAINAGAYTQIATTKSVSLTVQPSNETYYIHLRLTVSSAGQSRTTSRVVKVTSALCSNPKVCN